VGRHRSRIECRDGTYSIHADQLYEREFDKPRGFLNWPRHMAEKEWVDLDDFCTAFCVALAMHASLDNRADRRKALVAGDVVATCEHARRSRDCLGIDRAAAVAGTARERLRLVSPSEMEI
jgi:hypothetical protein